MYGGAIIVKYYDCNHMDDLSRTGGLLQHEVVGKHCGAAIEKCYSNKKVYLPDCFIVFLSLNVGSPLP